jgi:hypothetical protein
MCEMVNYYVLGNCLNDGNELNNRTQNTTEDEIRPETEDKQRSEMNSLLYVVWLQ